MIHHDQLLMFLSLCMCVTRKELDIQDFIEDFMGDFGWLSKGRRGENISYLSPVAHQHGELYPWSRPT